MLALKRKRGKKELGGKPPRLMMVVRHMELWESEFNILGRPVAVAVLTHVSSLFVSISWIYFTVYILLPV